ncbi:MAG: DUF1405 domain-containing protein [Anaerolineae bacterium]|nr:DUF1405 domain-containing protein [Anaerolineae bacterium]
MRQRLLDFVERRAIAWTIIAFNFVGFVTGIIFWYGGHLLSTANRWVLWPFIPDCPLFAGLFIIAFLGLRRGHDWRLFYTLTAFGLIKYGVWTVVYTLVYWWGGGALEPMSLTMGLTHVGMILEGVYVSYRIISPRARAMRTAGFRQRDVLIAFGWFLLSDFVDYGLGQYPRFDTSMVSLPLIQWHTIFMTFALAAAYLALSRQHGPEAKKERIR